MSSPILRIAAVLSVFVASAAHADWTSRINPDGKGANAEAKAQGKTLNIGCAKFMGDEMTLTLHGGPFEGMKNVDDAEGSMMMWIEMPDGRTARHPIDGHYYAPEKAFVGQFMVSDLVLEQFAGGKEMRFTTDKGNTLLTLPMKGSSKARADFRKACGL
jgi:hypothetical protein